MTNIQEFPKTKAFVIGPIGDMDADAGTPARVAYENGIEALEQIIVPACKSLEIEAFRADQIARSGEIPEQVFRHLRDSQIVIADLTDANPNVMYELGLRHTTGKLTIQIGERDRLPFDISTIRTILFKRTGFGFVEARRSLIRALAEGLDSGGDPVTATRIWFEPEDGQYAADASEKAEPLDSEEPGFLELIAETESGIFEIAQTLSTATSILAEIARILDEGTSRISGLPATGNYSAAKLAAANRVAAALDDPATRLNMVAQDFAKHVDRASPGMVYMLEQLIANPEQVEQAGEFPEQMRGLVEAAGVTATNSLQFGSAMQTSGDATRSMRRVTDSIGKSSTKLANASIKIASWQSLLDRIGA